MSCEILDCILTAAGTALEASFTDSTVIKRPDNVTSDGAGGRKPSSGDGYSTIATVLGLLATTRWQPRERAIANQTTAVVIHKWYGPASTDIRNQDRIVVDGRTFEVQGISMDASGLPLEAQVVELQKGQAL